MVKIKVTQGSLPQDGILKAQLPTTAANGQVAMPSRFTGRISTGVSVEVPSGYCLSFALLPELSKKGLSATNAPGRLTSGEVFIDVLNAGREIVTVKSGDPIIQVWVDRVYNWEAE